MSDETGTFGVRLRAWRRAAGLSQEDLAERSGLSIQAVGDLERGLTRRPYPDLARRLADALGLTGGRREEFIAAGRRPARAADAALTTVAVPSDTAEAGVSVRFGVLGPLQVVDGAGASWAVPSAKQRIVLATLLLATGSTVSATSLAEALWDTSPPPNAPAVMRTYVGRLRRVLGPAGGRIAGQPPGWAVGLHGPEEFDLALVDYLWRSAQDAAAAHKWREASSLLAQALSLWRGEPLVDVPSAALARREAERLAELRLRLTEARIDADLHAGMHGDLVVELRRLAAEHPFREHIRAQLMLACYRCGHQAAALEAYRDARTVLADELGVEPGHELQQTHQKILAADPGLTAGLPVPGWAVPGRLPAAPTQVTRTGELKAEDGVPDAAARAAGTAGMPAAGAPPGAWGGRTAEPYSPLELQDLQPAGEGSTPGHRAAMETADTGAFKHLCQLPPDTPDFTGRPGECNRLARLLAPAEGATAVPVIMLSGPPGAGKTCLAVHVAHAVRGHFPDGQLYVPLAGASTSPRAPGEVLGELLRALGAPPGCIPGPPEARSAMLRSRLADRRVLLLADDAATAAQVRMLIPGTAGCAVIVTSRDRLAGLTAAHLHLESLQPGEALQMLGRIAGEQRVAADRAAAVGLVAACGHLPLAVRIAGARLAARPSWPVATLTAMVSDQRQRLDQLTAGDLEVRATVELSYQALQPRARAAFRLLALAGPFDVAGWVVAVLLGSPQAADVVDLLADKSMLGAGGVDAAGQPRYRLHDLLRDYAGEQLAGGPQQERAAAFDRLLHAWLQLAHRADQAMPCNPYLPPATGQAGKAILPQDTAAGLTASPAAWFSTERLNLRHATAEACDSGHLALGLQLASRQAAFHHSQARFDEAEQLWQMVSTAASTASDKAVAAHATFGLAVTRALQGYHAEVSAVIGQCAAAFEEFGDQRALAWAAYWQADCSVITGRRAEALNHSQRGLALARKNQDPGAEIMLLREAAMAQAGIPGREGEAIAYAERALALARQAGEQTHELDTLRVLAHVNNLTGRHPAAEHIARQGIELAREWNYVADGAYFLGALGDACHGLGKYQDAIDAFGRALPTFRKHGLRRHEALCLLKMAESYQGLGNYRQARAYLAQCQPAFTELQMPAYVERTQKALALMPAIDRPDPRRLAR
jgi:DNA-binding SARP family transcriptional activator/transcriptional regulator with XRE-family HTH domain/tetratricopeptide (TPR) repeat protein